jgi:hypothetical protein
MHTAGSAGKPQVDAVKFSWGITARGHRTGRTAFRPHGALSPAPARPGANRGQGGGGGGGTGGSGRQQRGGVPPPPAAWWRWAGAGRVAGPSTPGGAAPAAAPRILPLHLPARTPVPRERPAARAAPAAAGGRAGRGGARRTRRRVRSMRRPQRAPARPAGEQRRRYCAAVRAAPAARFVPRRAPCPSSNGGMRVQGMEPFAFVSYDFARHWKTTLRISNIDER